MISPWAETTYDRTDVTIAVFVNEPDHAGSRRRKSIATTSLVPSTAITEGQSGFAANQKKNGAFGRFIFNLKPDTRNSSSGCNCFCWLSFFSGERETHTRSMLQVLTSCRPSAATSTLVPARIGRLTVPKCCIKLQQLGAVKLAYIAPNALIACCK